MLNLYSATSGIEPKIYSAADTDSNFSDWAISIQEWMDIVLKFTKAVSNLKLRNKFKNLMSLIKVKKNI